MKDSFYVAVINREEVILQKVEERSISSLLGFFDYVSLGNGVVYKLHEKQVYLVGAGQLGTRKRRRKNGEYN